MDTEVHDLVRWANASDLPSTRQIGGHAVGRVLVQLAVFADRNAEAWASSQTLADTISGLSRRDVRNALDALEGVGLIKRNGLRGRTTVWRLAVDMAGIPATSVDGEQAGHPATSSAGDMAGRVAGDVAGASAGYPATKRSEGKRTPRGRVRNVAGAPGEFGPTGRLDQW